MAAIPSETRQWVLTEHPSPSEKLDIKRTFKLESVPVIKSHPNQILVKTKYISNAPGLRVLIEKTPAERVFAPVTEAGDIVRTFSIIEVLESSNPGFKIGDLLYANLGWVEYAWIDPTEPALFVTAVPPELDPKDFFSLQIESRTAHLGFLKVGKASPSTKTLLVSAAGGATGSIVCQIAKNVLGIEKVIGVAGSAEKYRLLTSELGCDIALNYRDDDFSDQLSKVTPEHIDLFFDNVGGHVLDCAIPRMAKNGRIVSCGSVSSYDGSGAAVSAAAWIWVTKLRLNIEGFIFWDHASEFGAVDEDLRRWIKEGRLRIRKTVYQSNFEEIPRGLDMILKGKNFGSLVTMVVG